MGDVYFLSVVRNVAVQLSVSIDVDGWADVAEKKDKLIYLANAIIRDAKTGKAYA